jgi:ribosome recycling factor
MDDDVLNDLQARINKTLEDLKADLARVRTGRANLGILDGIKVDYYGAPTPLQGVASLHVADPRLITIKPWDKSMIVKIEKALQTSDIGLTPNNDGEMIRLPIPALTQERRKELVKVIKTRGEEHKVAIRNERRDAKEMLEEMVKEGELPEDDGKKAIAKMQAEVDAGIAKVDEIVAKKEKDIMEV